MINAILPFISIPLALATGSILPILIIHIPAIIYYAAKAGDMPKAPRAYIPEERNSEREAFERYQHYRIATGRTRR